MNVLMAYTAGVGNAAAVFLCIVHWLQVPIVTPPTVTVVSSGVGTAATALSTMVNAMHAGEQTVSF